MRRRRVAVVAAAVAAVVAVPALSGAAPLTPAEKLEPIGFFRFCADAQLAIANLDEGALTTEGISVGGTLYAEFDDFVLSKSSVRTTSPKAILTTTWYDFADAGETEPSLIRCKMRTAESLDEGAWPVGSANNEGRFAVDPAYGFGASVGAGLATSPLDQPCSVVNQQTIDDVWSELTPSQRDDAPFNPTGSATSGAAANTLVTTPDVIAASGPAWTQPQVPAVVNGSTLEVPSLALRVPTGGAGGNARFEGANYCTFIAPTYLRDLLLGNEVLP
jgi:hypothetical protein